MQRLRKMPLLSGVEFPFVWTDQAHRKMASKLAAYVDDEFYLKTNPDVRNAGVDPALHYVKYGWREGRDPSPSFSTQAYLEAHPNLQIEEVNPLLHFVEKGQFRTALTESDGTEGDASASTTTSQRVSSEIDVVKHEMDAEFYRSSYGIPAEVDVAEHYCLHGWRAGHDPSPKFSTSHYLTTNLDIRDSGVNPFWHYLIAGRAEGRSPKHLGGWRYDVLARQKPLNKKREEWVRREPPPRLSNASMLAQRISEARLGDDLVVSVGHDDYRKTPGGVQLCIALEAKRAREAQMDYLSLAPWQSLPTLSQEGGDPIVSVVLNSQLLGHARMSQVIECASLLGSVRSHLTVHHLMGHNPEQLLVLTQALGLTEVFFWVHDNFTLCTSYALQRNDIAFCNAPAPGSNACTICVYGAERARQFPRISALFDALDVHLVAPSKVALDFWRSRSPLTPASTTVQPHVRLRRRKAVNAISPAEACRIAFVGFPAPHKGWPVFERLLYELRHDKRYEFWMFGSEAPPPGVRQVQVHCTAETPRAMQEALREHKIDLVLHWATCRETFSFSTFEAMAAGAFVITNKGSGNVAAVVQRQKAGLVLEDEAALTELLRTDGLLGLTRQARARRAEQAITLSYSNVTLDFLEAERASP